MTKSAKAFLIILDGYGYNKNNHGNAINQAKKPYIDEIRKKYPTTLLKAHGEAVGLPESYFGNSEVGHFTIGAGRIVFQSLEEIDRSIKNKKFFHKKELLKTLEYVKKHNSALHLCGLISDKGVHAHLNHLFALLNLAEKHHLTKVYLHCFTDGRDVPEKSATKYIKQILSKIKTIGVGEIVSIVGRYFAMDRDQNWHRTQKTYELMVHRQGFVEKDPLSAINQAYKRGDATDYYIQPMLIEGTSDKGVKNNDAIIFLNFRTDRSRQLTEAFTEPKFTGFKTANLKIRFLCFGPYSKIAPVLFPMPKIKNTLGEYLSKKGLRQLRIAETEKYAHVTFFFNSQIKDPYPKEDRILIHSPKVPSYADKPEMSALKVTTAVLKEIKKEKYNLIILNFANSDLVGHSGKMKATIKCIEILNDCLKKIIPIALTHDYQILLTADHGNADCMLYPDGSICPAHSSNPVECTLISAKYKNCHLKKGKGLKDVAPTLLALMNLPKPKEMTGQSLIL